MRQITVEVPHGELADLERITLIESNQRKTQVRAYKRLRGKLPGQGRLKVIKLRNHASDAVSANGGAMTHTAVADPSQGTATVEQPLIAHPTMQHVSSSARARRTAALSKVFGILKGRDDAPQDGLAFQLEMRAE